MIMINGVHNSTWKQWSYYWEKRYFQLYNNSGDLEVGHSNEQGWIKSINEKNGTNKKFLKKMSTIQSQTCANII